VTGFNRNHPILATLKQNLAEYWQQESRELPAPAEMEAFVQAVERLQIDTEALAKRLRALECGPNR
jgi:ubiquinone biosynthesis protein UbiJ